MKARNLDNVVSLGHLEITEQRRNVNSAAEGDCMHKLLELASCPALDKVERRYAEFQCYGMPLPFSIGQLNVHFSSDIRHRTW